MPRWNPRWSLGASALVALAVAGCGAAGNQPKLHRNAEKRLLSLVTHARTDAAKQDGAAVHTVLGEFVAEVRTLRTAGQLSGSTAGRLDREARTTASQAARQLHPAPKPPSETTTATTATPPVGPATTTSPATSSTPRAQNNPRSTTANNGAQNDRGDACPGSTWSGGGPGHGHGYGHDGWHGCDQSGDGQGGGSTAWGRLWSYRPGGGGD